MAGVLQIHYIIIWRHGVFYASDEKCTHPPEAPTRDHPRDILISTLHINKATKLYL